jgi:hypothetical protein
MTLNAPSQMTLPAMDVIWPNRPLRFQRARLYTLLVITLSTSALAVAAVVAQTGLHVATREFARFMGMSLGMIVLSVVCHLRHDDKRLGEAAAIVGLLTSALVICALLSNGGLRLGMPVADEVLASIDGQAGIRVETFTREVVRWHLATVVLNVAYYSAGPTFVALLCWHLFRRNLDRAWELAATTAVAMQAVALVSIFAPARGAVLHFGLGNLAGLPTGAGTYAGDAFDRYYLGGSETLLSLDRMSGIVTFPSFHAVLALVIAQGGHGTRMFMGSYLVAGLIIVSAIPIGGHYACDLLAGGAVWLGAMVVVKRAIKTAPAVATSAPALRS